MQVTEVELAALRYLADTIANYVEEGFALTPLTGEGEKGKPDSYHKGRLESALREAKYLRAADAVKNSKE